MGVLKVHFLGEGVANGDATHVDTFLHVEIALVSPLVRPGVLDDPVLHSVAIDSETDCHDSMVDVIGGILANFGYVGAILVVLETIDHLEGNRNWSVSPNSFHHLIFVTFSNVD